MVIRRSRWWWTLVALFWRNWITALGATLTTIAAMLITAFVILGILGIYDTPYIGVMAFLVLPMVFVAGLILIPIGLNIDRKKMAGDGIEDEFESGFYPTFDFNKPRMRRMAGVVAILTAINLFILSFVSYQGVLFMDSTEFCGRTCHTVMEPEYIAYINSPHSRVECVECHIGPGAPWFVRSKLSGVGQVLAVTFDTYPRPVPTPVENLRPSRDTCEQCHWPEKFTGDRIRIITKYSEDEANTPLRTILLMHVGGGSADHPGIHSWHIDPRRQTTYIAGDRRRQTIPWVRVRQPDGTLTEFVSEEGGPTPEQPVKGILRTMDCIDCHNRPTHIYKMPDQAMDESMSLGQIDRSLPYIKQVGTDALRQASGPKDTALEQMAQRIRGYYQENYSDLYVSKQETIESSIEQIQNIYKRNVFPMMNVTWGTHPDNIGHERFTGCFRCHDDNHVSKDGRTIGQDCGLCHTILAMEEANPEVLDQLQPLQ